MSTPGEQLERLCAGGRRAVLLVAPFVKAATLARLLGRIAEGVPVRCITRWHLEEIAAGVSDLEVWPLLRDRPGGELWLRSDLHAKYYRADEGCLVGSANLTGAALGWSAQNNLELLVELPAGAAQCLAFEQQLFSGLVQVDEDLYQLTAEAASLLKVEALPLVIAETREQYAIPAAAALPDDIWLPTLRHPEDLYLAYSGRAEELTEAGRVAALADLAALRLPPGLDRPSFTRCVGATLLQRPVVRAIDTLLAVPQRFGAVRDELAQQPCAATPASPPPAPGRH